MRIFLYRTLALLAITAIFLAHPAYAVSSGPNSPGTLADDASVGTEAWSNASSASSQNDAYASVTIGAGGVSHYLKATNFGFSIPSGSTIDGIVVEVDKYVDDQGVCAYEDNAVRVVKGGTIGSTDKSSASFWASSDTDTYTSYGSATDLWGETWTTTDINASNFGVALSGRYDSGSCMPLGDNMFIDHIRLTIHYTVGGAASLPAPAPAAQQTSDPQLSSTSDFDLHVQKNMMSISSTVSKIDARTFTVTAGTSYLFSVRPPEYEHVRAVTLRTNGQAFLLRPQDGGAVHAFPAFRFFVLGRYPYALTADYGVTTLTEHGAFIVKPPETALSPLLESIPFLFKAVFGRPPTQAEQLHWEQRVLHYEKTTVEALRGAMEWLERSLR